MKVFVIIQNIMRKNITDLNYSSFLNLRETQIAIKFIKDNFEELFSKKMNLLRVSAPLFVFSSSGLNDNLNGWEEPVKFDIPSLNEDAEIVHSLAKWKRSALKKYNIPYGQGLYTDMNAIRRNEVLDHTHSLYVDQWDWEKVIIDEERKLSFLKKTVKKIYSSIKKINSLVSKKYPLIKNELPDKIFFISSNKLESLYPTLTREEREDEITRIHKAVFIYKIGYKLKDGLHHSGRAADYDDWNLNGDLLLYYDLYDMALEISSMGIRVNKESLLKQLKYKNEEYKLDNSYAKDIINNNIPLSIGGGIGQSRLCMFLLKKAHIGEVQSSLWADEYIDELKKININLL